MTRLDHLLTTFAEEAVEVAQRATKALRFGINEVQPGQTLTNAERINGELNDLMALHLLLVEAGALKAVGWEEWMAALAAKRAKFEMFLEYSAQQGRLTSPPSTTASLPS